MKNIIQEDEARPLKNASDKDGLKLRVDHYFNIFFIPILRVKKGEPFIMCDNCERNIHDFGMEDNLWQGKKDLRCSNCGRALHKDFKFCPFCGKQVS